MNITSVTEFDKVIQKKVFILFSADYCGDCKKFKPIFHQQIEKNEAIKWYYLDTAQFPTIAQREKIKSIPNLKIYESGKAIDALRDYTEEGLEQFIAKHQN